MATITVHVDGKPIEVEEGTNLIEVARLAGKHIPHYCYHPKMSAPGNCRMCSVHIANAQFPDKPYGMACIQGVREYKDKDGNVTPMEVVTDNEQLAKMRQDIMEFLLINHPLDCPQCQQSGICELQNYAYTYAPNSSRFTEQKVQRHRKELGPNVSIFGNRCISCDRCARFCREITGTSELSLINRGDKSVIDIEDAYPLNNPMSLCTVDICPVGALLSNDFLYKARPWFLDPKPSLTPDSKGSNAFVDVHQNKIQRIRPRDNDAVNECWMADQDRLNYGWVADKSRLSQHRQKGETAGFREVMASAGDALKALVDSGKGGETAVVGSAWMLNEELILLHELAGALGVSEPNRYARKHPDGTAWVSQSGWRIEADRNPNREGLQRFFGVDEPVDMLEDLAARIHKGDVKHVVIAGHIGGHGFTEAFSAACDKLDTLIVIDATESSLTGKATHAFAGTCWYEKQGTVISRVTSGHGDSVEPELRIQAVHECVTEPGEARQDLDILQRLISAAAGEKARPVRMASIFARLKERADEFDGLTLKEVGALGTPLERKAVTS